MGNKIPILSQTIKQLFLLTEILNKYELQDLKWQILSSIPETNNAITSWIFTLECLYKIPEIIKSKRKITDFELSKDLVYDDVTIERFENLFEFKNNIEFLNFFDICMYAYVLYFKILDDISINFDMYPPKNKVFINFSDIINEIAKNGDNYKILSNIITIPIIVDIYETDIIIDIKTCDKLPKNFIGLFNKMKEYVLCSNNNKLIVVEFIIEEILGNSIDCDCFTTRYNMK